MKTYIRLGEIPTTEKSINYFTNNNEVGVSVFNNKNNAPELTNLQLISSLSARLEHKAYLVTGDEIGTGNDGEPLLSNIKVVSELNLTKESRIDLVFNALKENYEVATGVRNVADTFFGYFVANTKRNIKTGEVVDYYDNFGEAGYEKLAPYKIISYNGVDFTKAKKDFDTHLGYKN